MLNDISRTLESVTLTLHSMSTYIHETFSAEHFSGQIVAFTLNISYLLSSFWSMDTFHTISK